MSIRVVTPPAAYPVLLSEARDWCRCYTDDTSQDGVINLLIQAMVNHAENLTGRAFVERTYELNLPYFERTIELPFPPLIGVDSVGYTDINGATQTVDASVYEADTVQEPGRIQPNWRKFWPVIAGLGYTFNPVRIQYRAGYVAPGSPQDLTDNSYLPPQLRLWMQARIGTLYDNRSVVIIERATVDVLPRDFADGLLDSLIVGTRLF
jgi:uncharacterized phiE125 gp8 family phage protein